MSVDLQKYKTAQRFAYSCAEKAAAQLAVGMTERDVAQLLKESLNAGGATDFLHRPFAWFAERSGFLNMRGFRDYLPSNRTLTANDVVVLDVSPIVDGHIGDIGLSVSLSPHAGLEKAKASLRKTRALIPQLFMSDRPLGEVWKAVEQQLNADGFQNAYTRYPFSVLGHRVPLINRRTNFLSSLPVTYLSWFGNTAYLMFLKYGISKQLIRKNSKQAKEGVWAIEPHLSGDGFGAKFEEILVVEKDRAYWLDDDVPHMRGYTATA